MKVSIGLLLLLLLLSRFRRLLEFGSVLAPLLRNALLEHEKYRKNKIYLFILASVSVQAGS